MEHEDEAASRAAVVSGRGGSPAMTSGQSGFGARARDGDGVRRRCGGACGGQTTVQWSRSLLIAPQLLGRWEPRLSRFQQAEVIVGTVAAWIYGD